MLKLVDDWGNSIITLILCLITLFMYVVGYAIHTSIYVSVGSFVKSIRIYFSESLPLLSVLSHLLIFL